MEHIGPIYELSNEADYDLQDIYDYTAKKFGSEQAITYLTELDDLFNHICSHPSEIKRGLRSISHVSQIIFYRIVEKRIRIVRVLHVSRDIPRFP